MTAARFCKILTVWAGPPPDWYPLFRERVAANPGFDHELVRVPGPEALNEFAEQTLGVPCRKGSVYAQCDLRPWFGFLFANLLRGYRYWGWSDLDVVWGDLRSVLGGHLESCDVVSTEFYCTNGGMCLFRNREDVNTLWERAAGWRAVLARPGYLNFDETGGGLTGPGWGGPPGGFTRVVRESGLRYHFSDLSWGEGRDMIGPLPSRYPVLDGGRLVEVPTGREIHLYHFGSKRWPIGRFDHLG